LLEQNLTLEQEEGQRRREEWQPYCHRLRKAAPHEVDKAAGDFDTGYRRDKQSGRRPAGCGGREGIARGLGGYCECMVRGVHGGEVHFFCTCLMFHGWKKRTPSMHGPELRPFEDRKGRLFV